jgi:hypothetical protein
MGKKRTPEQKERYKLAAQKRWADANYRKKQKEGCLERSQNEEYLEKVSAGVKAWCQDNPDKLAARQAKIAFNIAESGVLKGRKRPEHSSLMSILNKERWNDSEWKEKQILSKVIAGRVKHGPPSPNDKEFVNHKRRLKMKDIWKDPAYQKAVSDGLVASNLKPEVRARRSEAAKKMWRDPNHDSIAHAAKIVKNGQAGKYEYLDRTGALWIFKSGEGWELSFARWLDMQELTWLYESRTFLLSSGERYTPDFWVQEWDTFIEIKGGAPGSDRKCLIAVEDGLPILIVRSPKAFMHWAEATV